jgi:hypothetical protein
MMRPTAGSQATVCTRCAAWWWYRRGAAGQGAWHMPAACLQGFQQMQWTSNRSVEVQHDMHTNAHGVSRHGMPAGGTLLPACSLHAVLCTGQQGPASSSASLSGGATTQPTSRSRDASLTWPPPQEMLQASAQPLTALSSDGAELQSLDAHRRT